MPQFVNEVTATATFGSDEVFDTSTSVVDIPSIRVTKQADRAVWRGTETLLYTITVENIDNTETAIGVSLEDIITPTVAKLVDNSVTIGGEPATATDDYTYNETTGTLTITGIDDITVGGSVEVTFRIEKV